MAFANNFFIKEFTSSQVKIAGPNKFVVKIHGEKHEEKYSYDVSLVSYSFLTNNIFTVVDAPNNFLR